MGINRTILINFKSNNSHFSFMNQSTRTALKLGAGATDANAADALDKDGHKLTLRELEKSDSAFVLYLKKDQPDTYARLYKAQYGKEPQAPNGSPAAKPVSAATAQQAKIKLAALGPDVTMRQLEKENPKLLLELKHSAPEEYSRLFTEAYGKAPSGTAPNGPAPKGPATGAPLNLAALATDETPSTGQWRYKAGVEPPVINMAGEMSEEQLAAFPAKGHDFASDPRFERVEE